MSSCSFNLNVLVHQTILTFFIVIRPIDNRGLTMSIYTSFQFFGTFLGGLIGGYLYDRYGLSGIFFFTAVISVVWTLNCLTIKNKGASIVGQ